MNGTWYFLSLDLSDTPERNQQVMLMRLIYQQAEQVIVWLGSEDDTTGLAIQTMQNIFESYCSIRYGQDSQGEFLRSLESNKNYWQSLQVDTITKISPQWPNKPKACANALQIFFQKQWFSRVWVIQEVQGKSCILMKVGGTTVAWNVVATAAIWVVHAPSSITQLDEPHKFGGFLNTDFMRRKLFTTKDDVPFLEVLDRCRAFKCTIDKDRIFALLHHPVARLLEAQNEQESATEVLYPPHVNSIQDATHFNLTVDYNLTLFDGTDSDHVVINV